MSYNILNMKGIPLEDQRRFAQLNLLPAHIRLGRECLRKVPCDTNHPTRKRGLDNSRFPNYCLKRARARDWDYTSNNKE